MSMLQTITLPPSGIRDFPFGVEKKSLKDGFYEHYHDYTEINVIVRGTATHIVNGNPQPIRPGDVFVLNPGTSHGFADSDNLILYQAMYDAVLLEPFLSMLKRMSGYHALFIIEPAIMLSENSFRNYMSLGLKDLEAIVMLFENMIKEFDARMEGCQALLLANLISLVTTLSRLYRDDKEDNPEVIRRVARVASWIEENYLSLVSLGQLAQTANCSVCQLIRDFKKSYGTTPVCYVLHLRIEHAILLLRSTTLTITEIAFSCCFSDSNYFSRVFKQHTGLTPSQFRGRG
jgi:AraC-like DNA-binding protein